MRVRIVGAAFVMVALLAGCGSSSSSSPPSTSSDTPDTLSAADVDVQAAKACKTMEEVLSSTNDGQIAISGEQAAEFQNAAGLLIRTPEGNRPKAGDTMPTWYELGTAQVSLYVAVSSQEPADVKTYTDQARALCLTVPQEAQDKASYTPVPTTP